jgi:NAD(P)-dependent dehydrogenase (short-subunit alcohol dehydrogenase family)
MSSLPAATPTACSGPPPKSARGAPRLSTPPTRRLWTGSSPTCPSASTTCWSPAPGPYYAPLAERDRDQAHRDFDDHIWLAVAVAQHTVGRVRPGGTLLFMGGTGGRSRGPGLSLIAAGTAALPALIANLTVEVAPIRVNLIAAGFVDTPLSASLLGDDLQAVDLPVRSRPDDPARP